VVRARRGRRRELRGGAACRNHQRSRRDEGGKYAAVALVGDAGAIARGRGLVADGAHGGTAPDQRAVHAMAVTVTRCRSSVVVELFTVRLPRLSGALTPPVVLVDTTSFSRVTRMASAPILAASSRARAMSWP
jgi:hypothetical protein